MPQTSMSWSILRGVIGLVVGGWLVNAGIAFFQDYRVSVDWPPHSNHPLFFSCPLLAAITLTLGGLCAIVVGLLGWRFWIKFPEPELPPGCFRVMPKGPILFLGSLISLTLPPLFLWQAWVIVTEFVRLGRPPFYWFFVGGEVIDWIAFFVFGFLWLMPALIGFFSPIGVFYAGLGLRLRWLSGTNECKLRKACRKGWLDLVEKLLAAGADPNAKDQAGKTALMFAAGAWDYGGHGKIVEALLAAGADVAVTDQEGRTALMHAGCGVGRNQARAATTRLLLRAGADIHARDAKGETALFLASLASQVEVVEALLVARADPNICDLRGTTPLMIAIDSFFVDERRATLVRKLLAAGADPNAKREDGMTPLLLAKRRHDLHIGETINLLRAAIADRTVESRGQNDDIPQSIEFRNLLDDIQTELDQLKTSQSWNPEQSRRFDIIWESTDTAISEAMKFLWNDSHRGTPYFANALHAAHSSLRNLRESLGPTAPAVIALQTLFERVVVYITTEAADSDDTGLKGQWIALYLAALEDPWLSEIDDLINDFRIKFSVVWNYAGHHDGWAVGQAKKSFQKIESKLTAGHPAVSCLKNMLRCVEK